MKIHINLWFVVLAILGLVAVFYWYGYTNGQSEGDRLSTSLRSALNDTIRHYQVEVRGLQRDVYEKQQMVLTKSEALELAVVDKERYRKLYLKSIDNVTTLEAQISVLLDSIANNVQVVYVPVKDSVSFPCAKLPFSFWEKNEYLDLTGRISETAKVSLSLITPVSLDLTIGIKKKAQTPTAIVTTPNPYVRIDGISSVKIIRKEHFWDKTWFKVGLGAVAGGAIVSKLK